MTTNIKPITVRKAREMYRDERAGDIADRTLQNQERHLKSFTEWCDTQGIEHVHDLSGRDFHEFRLARKKEIATSTLSMQMSYVRSLIQFCERIDTAPQDLSESIEIPSSDDDARTVMLDPDTAEAMLQYLRRFEYASRDHAILEVVWHTAIRLGALRALDLEDYHPRNGYVELQHRPETDTPLKNARDAERAVSLNKEVCTILDDYIGQKRVTTTDSHGREPLFTTSKGRVSEETVRFAAYQFTRPCLHGECPDGHDPETCDWMKNKDNASKCPYSVSTHPIRRGSITHHLLNDVPREIVSDRCDVSTKVLDKHYDGRSEVSKMEQRKQYLDNL